MRIIYINKPVQDSYSNTIELIDGETYHWCVKTSSLNFNETLKEWIDDKVKFLKENNAEVNTILLYDIYSDYNNLSSNLHIRYDLITTKIK